MSTDLSTIAANMVSPSAHTRICGAIDYFRFAERCDSFLLAYKNPDAADYTVIHRVGYSDSVASHLTGDLASMPEFDEQFSRCHQVTDWIDIPDFADSYSGAEVLQPEGFNNGFLMVLHDGNGRQVGMCQGNIERSHFTEHSKEILESMRPTFTDYVSKHHQRSSFRLTAREQEILDLLRKGLSNSDIGAELVLSTRTVSTHVERILRKLGVTNRVAAAMRAAETFLPEAHS